MKEKIEISKLTKKLWLEQDKFTEEEEISLKKFISIPKNKIIFLESINSFRGQGMHLISDKLFYSISNMFFILLENFENKIDYEIIKYCLILSQTFYKIDNSEKIFLQESIKDYKNLKDLSFWEEFISYILFEEIEKSNEFINKVEKNENEEEKQIRLSNIYFSQMVYAISNMKIFKFSSKDIKNTIISFCSQNEFLENFENEIKEFIEN